MRFSFILLISGFAMLGVISRTSLAQPVISIEGTCPQRLTFRWEGASPDHHAALIVARGTGHFTIPAIACSGTVLGLQGGVQLVATFRTGPEGRGELTGHARQDLCGQFAQVLVVDGHPCSTSNVVQIPQ